MPTLRKIEISPDLTDQVYETLLEAISTAELAPGARITQQGLAESLNVSRQPVLQALRVLRKDGFVIDSGRRGLIVAPIDPSLIRQTYQVRSVLDGLAAREAAKRGAKLNPKMIEDGRRAFDARKISDLIHADLLFHQSIYEKSGNDMIYEAAKHHWRHIRRAMGAVLTSLGDEINVWDEHEQILKAIDRRDVEAAERLARTHAEEAGESLARALTARDE
ncbi:MAG: GntR family transcriptional regulator [Burkholderiales bacterium]|jgi:DNA-binding GntR family transcriptional regulator